MNFNGVVEQLIGLLGGKIPSDVGAGSYYTEKIFLRDLETLYDSYPDGRSFNLFMSSTPKEQSNLTLGRGVDFSAEGERNGTAVSERMLNDIKLGQFLTAFSHILSLGYEKLDVEYNKVPDVSDGSLDVLRSSVVALFKGSLREHLNILPRKSGAYSALMLDVSPVTSEAFNLMRKFDSDEVQVTSISAKKCAGEVRKLLAPPQSRPRVNKKIIEYANEIGLYEVASLFVPGSGKST